MVNGKQAPAKTQTHLEVLIGLTFEKTQLVETFSTLTDPVHDLAFAPNIGRSYHVLGIAGR